MAKDLTESKCHDCEHCVLTGWWDPQKMCEISGWPVNPDGPACISIKPKGTKQ